MAKDVKYRIKAEDKTSSATSRARRNFAKVGEAGAKAADKIGKAFRRAGRAALTSFTGALTKGIGNVRGALVGATAAATALTTALIFGGAKSRGTYEALKLRLEGVTGSAEEAEKVFKSIAKFAESTPFALEDLVRAQILLKAVGMDGEKALKSVADAAAVMGSDVESIAMAVASLESEPLKRLGIRLQTLGDQFTFTFKDRGGKDVKLFAKGAEEARKTLTKVFDKKFEGSVTKLSQSLFGLISTLKDVGTATLAAFGAKFEEPLKKLVEQLTKSLGNLANSPFLDKLAKRVGEIFQMASLIAEISGGNFKPRTEKGQGVSSETMKEGITTFIKELMEYLLAVLSVGGARMGRAFLSELSAFNWKKIATFFFPLPSQAHTAPDRAAKEEEDKRKKEMESLSLDKFFKGTRDLANIAKEEAEAKAKSDEFNRDLAAQNKENLDKIFRQAMNYGRFASAMMKGIKPLEQIRKERAETFREQMKGRRASEGFGARTGASSGFSQSLYGFGVNGRFQSTFRNRKGAKATGDLLRAHAKQVSTDAVFDRMYEGATSIKYKAGESKATPLFVQEVKPPELNGVN